MAVITLIALASTIPWDNCLIVWGVWWYGEGRVAARLRLAPVEGYLYIVCQPVLTVLWLSHHSLPTWTDDLSAVRHRIGAGLAGLAVAVIGIGLLAWRPGTFYLEAVAVRIADGHVCFGIHVVPGLSRSPEFVRLAVLIVSLRFLLAGWCHQPPEIASRCRC